jgi:hypothetical protein
MVAPLRVSGGGSTPFRVKEGENSIAEYGVAMVEQGGAWKVAGLDPTAFS